MTNAGDWFDSEAAKARHEKLRKAKDWFNSDFVKQAAQQQAIETLAWLRRNDRSFTAAGEERREPWWPQPKTTDHVGLKVRRLKHLLDRAYEHGIQHFMFGLKEKGAVEARLGSRHINLLVSAMTPVVINELAGYPLIGDNSYIRLAKLRDLFGNGKRTKPARIRDSRLIPLAGLGLLEGAPVKDGYNVRIGHLGLVFFKDVYAPIVDETDVAFNRKASQEFVLGSNGKEA